MEPCAGGSAGGADCSFQMVSLLSFFFDTFRYCSDIMDRADVYIEKTRAAVFDLFSTASAMDCSWCQKSMADVHDGSATQFLTLTSIPITARRFIL